MKLLKIIFVSFILISCKSSFYESSAAECAFFDKLINDDQRYRGLEIVIDPFFKILDSLKIDSNLTKEDYINLEREKRLEFGRKARNIADKRIVDTILVDSLMKLQVILDNKNTKELLSYIKKNGYPNINKLKCKQSPDLVFLHSQEKYHKKIKNIIDLEYKNKNINEFLYLSLLRHLGGRKENDLQKILINSNDSQKKNIIIK